MKKEWEFEMDDRMTKIALVRMEALILRDYGKRCKTKAPRCSSCRVWIAFDNLKVNL